jgi:outer membrane protein OmpA-like peptidoglycan-associated protein
MNVGLAALKGRSREEAEKPFWISYADLMTALMILFLVVMVTALAAISKQTEEVVKAAQKGTAEKPIPWLKSKDMELTETQLRVQEIAEVCNELAEKNRANPHVMVDCKMNRINFGEVGQFKTDQYRLGAEGEVALAKLVPTILETANTPLGQKWLKQVLIEGYTDTDGSYLYNLSLSLKRSEWVMCTLLAADNSALAFNAEQRRQIKKLFLAGGVAFNNIRASKDASRRVELRLQFYGTSGEQKTSPDYETKFDDNAKEKCMI